MFGRAAAMTPTAPDSDERDTTMTTTTKSADATIILTDVPAAPTATDLVRTQAALDKLKGSLAKGSLGSLIQSKRRSLLLVDCSSSMREPIRSGERRIDALRKVVANLRSTHPVPVAAFPGTHGVELVDSVPEPRGMTPLHWAIEFGTRERANHLVVVTDGEPDSEPAAFEAARAFGGPIDVFFIGDAGTSRGAQFARQLAEATGGTFNLTDLGKPKELGAKITALLGDGSAL
jgi:Mg-chelatase subunit ChlD